MKYILLTIFSAFSFFTNAAEWFENMPEESLSIRFGEDQKIVNVLPCKAFVSIGKAMSRVRVKKTEIQSDIDLPVGEHQYYVRGKSGATHMPLVLVKLDDKGKKIEAFYSQDLNKDFKIIPMTHQLVDKEKQIYRVSILSVLEVGYYAFLYKRVDDKGNFRMSQPTAIPLTYKPMVFRIGE